MSWPVMLLGYVLLIGGMVLVDWAETVNPFFEPGVRIQTERGHRVVDTGPYAIVCYPGYVAASFMFAGFALSLGSRWALIPAGFGSLVLVLRMIWEDRTLQCGMPEYAAYARRVQFRLIPGVW
jgi:protein-S-isoprenylcysteine O-methyltransferase Ste14